MIFDKILKEVLSSFDDGIIMLDNDGATIFANSIGEKIFALGEPLDDEPIEVDGQYYRLKKKQLESGQLLIWRNVSEIEAMKKFMVIDPETNAYTAAYMKDMLERELDRVHRSGLQMALMLIDVDRGESGPSKAEIVKAIKNLLRIYDLVGLGDNSDFMVMLFSIDSTKIEAMGHRFLRALKELGIPKISIGICMSERVPSAEAMLRQAQRALFVVNARGGNDISIY